MSKTRKIRRARNRAIRAEFDKQQALQTLDNVQRETANARTKFRYLTEVLGKLGHSDLFYALVHGVQYSSRRIEQPKFNLPEHTADLHPRKLESMAQMACVEHVTYHNLEAIAFAIEQHNNIGQVISVRLGEKQVLAVDVECIKHIPERMLALELGEYAAEAIKEIKHRV